MRSTRLFRVDMHYQWRPVKDCSWRFENVTGPRWSQAVKLIGIASCGTDRKPFERRLVSPKIVVATLDARYI